MKRIALPCLLALLCLCPVWTQAAPLLSKNMAFYARDMEFYYQNPRPEVLVGMLRCFDSHHVLEQGEKRLMLAAFLAEVLQASPEARSRLFPLQEGLSAAACHAMAWAVHLTRLPDKEKYWRQIPGALDPNLQKHLAGSPSPLSRWNILSAPQILQMYWGAFMATGSLTYLDPIISAAQKFGRLKTTGNQHAAEFKVCQMAAASLYEFAPQHKLIRQRLQKRLQGLSGAEARTLRTILRQ